MADPIYGIAFLEIRPDLTGFASTLTRETDRESRGIGQRIGSTISDGVLSAASAASAAMAGLFTTSLVKGVGRLTAIENAEASLRGLGHTAEEVEGIMDSALESVLGTAFGLDEAASIAATAVAAGVEPGRDLTRVLSLMGDAAVIARVPLSEMGQIFGQVIANGRAMSQELNRLQDRGIPIIQWLAEEFNVTAAEMRDMVAQGVVDSETYLRAIENNIAGAALAAGDTTQGALQNLGAALGRFGAALADPAFGQAQGIFTGLTEVVDNMTDSVKSGMEDMVSSEGWQTFERFVTDIPQLADVAADKLGELGTALGPLAGGFAALGTGALGALPIIGQFIPRINPLVGVIGGLVAASPELRRSLFDVAEAVVPLVVQLGDNLVPTVVNLVDEALPPLVGILNELVPLLNAIEQPADMAGRGLGFLADVGVGAGKSVAEVGGAFVNLLRLDFAGFANNVEQGSAALQGIADRTQLQVGVEYLTKRLAEGTEVSLAMANAMAFLDRQGELTADSLALLFRTADVDLDKTALGFLREMAESGVFKDGLDDIEQVISSIEAAMAAEEQQRFISGFSEAGAAMRQAADDAGVWGTELFRLEDAMPGLNAETATMSDVLAELQVAADEAGMSVAEFAFSGDDAANALLDMLDPTEHFSANLQLIAADAEHAANILDTALAGTITEVSQAFVDANEDGAVSAQEFLDALIESETARAEFNANLLEIATVAPELAARLSESGAEAAASVAAGFAEDLDLAEQANQVVTQQTPEIAALIDSAVMNATDLLETDPAALALWTAFASSLGVPGLTGEVTSAIDHQLGVAIDDVRWDHLGGQGAIGLVDGMVAYIDRSMAARVRVAVTRAMESGLQIQSPSKLMEGFGVLSAEGFVIGMGNELRSANFGFDDVALRDLRGASVSVGTSGGGGDAPLIGEVNVINPVGEPTEESLQDPGLRAVVSSYLVGRP